MKLEIPFPCSEKIENMTEAQNGKFCASCDKIVIDFTNMSVDDIKDYLIQYGNQKTCGIFRTETIANQEFAIPLEIIQLNHRRAKNVFLLAFAVAFGFVLFGCQDQTTGKMKMNHQVQNDSIQSENLQIDTKSNLQKNHEPHINIKEKADPFLDSIRVQAIRIDTPIIMGGIIESNEILEPVKIIKSDTIVINSPIPNLLKGKALLNIEKK